MTIIFIPTTFVNPSVARMRINCCGGLSHPGPQDSTLSNAVAEARSTTRRRRVVVFSADWGSLPLMTFQSRWSMCAALGSVDVAGGWAVCAPG